MFEAILQFHDSLPFLVRVGVDYFLGVIIIRGWLGNEILAELQSRGFFKKGMLHGFITSLSKWEPLARKIAIVQHYRGGHDHDLSVGCSQGRCGTTFSHA